MTEQILHSVSVVLDSAHRAMQDWFGHAFHSILAETFPVSWMIMERSEQISYSIIGGVLVASVVESIHYWARRARRWSEIADLRRLFKDLEASSTKNTTYDDVKRFVTFKSNLQVARHMVMYSGNLRVSERTEIRVLLDLWLNQYHTPADGKYPETDFYEFFFKQLRKLKWLKL